MRCLRWSLLMLWAAVAVHAAPEPVVCVIPIHEDITHNTLYLVRRGVKEAERRGATALVLDMDTNGGRVDVTEEIMRLLLHTPIPTYTFVDQKAYSAGAFIAVATKAIYMSPGSVIGAATPVMLMPGSGPAELPKSYEEKITSALRALIRSTAQQQGHNPDVFEAMVDADKEVKIGDVMISEKGKLLTLTNEEAAHEYGEPPQPLVSAGTVATMAEVLQKLDLAEATEMRIEPYGFELIARWITMLAPLLIMVGVAAIYIEMQAPGIGVPALVAVIAFGIYFLGFFVAGLTGWEEAVVFAVGVVLLAIEVFVLPGFGVTGVLGILAILAALVMAMIPVLPFGQGFQLPTWDQLQGPLVRVSVGIGGAMVALVVLGRYLPRSAWFQKLELAATTSAAEGYVAARGDARDLIGAAGVAETMLRPAGKGRFGERLVDVVTDGDLIERGTPITIVEVAGSRVLVRRV